MTGAVLPLGIGRDVMGLAFCARRAWRNAIGGPIFTTDGVTMTNSSSPKFFDPTGVLEVDDTWSRNQASFRFHSLSSLWISFGSLE